MLGVIDGQATSYGASSAGRWLCRGRPHRAAAAQFRVSIKVANDRVLLKRATGSLGAKLQGNGGGHGRQAGVADWIRGPDTVKVLADP